MRFVEDGLSVPDTLLTARDAGQVLFFCGAGVSKADAQLPDFATLAKRVGESLGSVENYEEGIAVDRIFGMLEREFETAEVREAVAKELEPKPGHHLNAHRIVLDLSRTQGGVPRLVTTNFDLLFEECEPRVASSNPPRLPDPRREGDFRGIIHLHGCVDAQYRRAKDDEFVLSSAEFGHAYLSDGWATRYFLSLLQRFRIVFLGYSANDPPIQYLLEALTRFATPAHGLYAFQAGDSEQAAAQWRHKGVEPICYDNANDHAALWESLSAWAERARDVHGWHDRLLDKAARGPAFLAAHERGMIAHLVSTASGARFIATSPKVLPAEWLFVIDRLARYGQTRKVAYLNGTHESFEAFDVFQLDSDTPPAQIDPANRFHERTVPDDAWDGFASTQADCANLTPERTAQLRARAGSYPELPPRLRDLGIWIVKIAHQPAALWWAASQSPLHQVIQENIERSLRQDSVRYSPVVRDGWRSLLACWQQRPGDPTLDRYALEDQAMLEGWSPPLVRKAIALYQSILIVEPSHVAKAPMAHPELALSDIVRVDVKYQRPHEPPNVPPAWLGYAVTLFRQQIELSVELERDVTGQDDVYLDTIRPDDGEILDEDCCGLTGHLVAFTNMMKKLSEVDVDAARREVKQWSGTSDNVFTRLRIWAGAQVELTTPEEAGHIFLNLDDEAFWVSHTRDLLFALRDRWCEFPPSFTIALEARLLEGPIPRYDQRQDCDELKAFLRLQWLYWLSTQGVIFSFDFETETGKLRAIARDWTEDAIRHFAQPHVSKVFRIEADTSATPLERVPLGEVLDKAEALRKHQVGSHVTHHPFQGLARDRPARALSALTDAARKGTFSPWAWSELLYSDREACSSRRLLSAVGHRLARLSSDRLAEIAHPVSEWLRDGGEQLLSKCPRVFDLVFDAMVGAMKATREVTQIPHPGRRWLHEALNRPGGRLAEAIFKDPGGKVFKAGDRLPSTWTRRLNQLLDLHGDHRSHALVVITSKLNWLFHIDPDWTADRLLPLSNDVSEEGRPFWVGYFWMMRVPQHPLYLLLKDRFIALARAPALYREHAGSLASILLAGWGDDEDAGQTRSLISDSELRKILVYADDNLRSRMLGHLKHRALNRNTHWGSRLIPFLTQVWPRQRAVRSANSSEKLADLALAFPDRFPELVAAMLPRLVQIERLWWMMNWRTEANTEIVDAHPMALLDLLWAVLSENAAEWPDQTSEVIARLATRSETQTDPRLAELLRREQQGL